MLLDNEVAISINGVGPTIGNIFIVTLWHTIKRDYVYLNLADSGDVLRDGLETLVDDYNENRSHGSLDDATPDEA